MTSGRFSIDATTANATAVVAVGMPRASGLLGKVQLYTAAMTEVLNPLFGDQFGAYFGYAMCAADVDGDGLDDLLVGAPLYTPRTQGSGAFETGRVYIWLRGHRDTRFGERSTLEGHHTRGRFGLALASLGDINRDGYGDFAVGAPYESYGSDGTGAVYIYHGSATGPTEQASQVIRAADVGGGPRTFGFSVAGSMDLDGNGYPDVAVGAYESGRVYTFRTRAVISVRANVTFASANKMLTLDVSTNVTCVAIDTCLEFGGENRLQEVQVELRWQLDAIKRTSRARMFFMRQPELSERNGTLWLQHSIRSCVKDQVCVRNDVRDKLTPMDVKMWYQIRETSDKKNLDAGMLAGPMMDPKQNTMQKDSMHIQKNCGWRNVCVPDLRLHVE